MNSEEDLLNSMGLPSFRRHQTSSALLGRGAATIRTMPQQRDDGGLQFCQHGIETQPAAPAFGSAANLCWVTNRCAAVTNTV